MSGMGTRAGSLLGRCRLTGELGADRITAEVFVPARAKVRQRPVRSQEMSR